MLALLAAGTNVHAHAFASRQVLIALPAATAGTPPAIMARLARDIIEVLKSPVVTQQPAVLEFEPWADTATDFAAICGCDLPVWHNAMQKSGARAA